MATLTLFPLLPQHPGLLWQPAVQLRGTRIEQERVRVCGGVGHVRHSLRGEPGHAVVPREHGRHPERAGHPGGEDDAL